MIDEPDHLVLPHIHPCDQGLAHGVPNQTGHHCMGGNIQESKKIADVNLACVFIQVLGKNCAPKTPRKQETSAKKGEKEDYVEQKKESTYHC